MNQEPRICKNCSHFVTEATAPQCGRVRGPVLGTPVRSCETERLYGFDQVTARDCATKLDACGPDGTYYVEAPVKQSKRRFFPSLGESNLSYQS